jgi:predicted enzyme related to lactoylglutathione lyase
MDKVVHFEIPFDDKARATRFYAEVFGWKLTDVPDMSYVMAETVPIDEQHKPKEPGAINGGLFQRPRDAPAPTLYMDVASITDAIRKVEANGGRVVTPKTPIPGMGAYARVADSEGNVIGLFESA